MANVFIPDDYNTGLCSCFSDCNSCLDGFFCPYCTISAEYSMLEYRRPGVDWLLCCGLFWADVITMGIAGLISVIMTRSSANALFGLRQDSDLISCCKACCCASCSTCQVYREMSIRYLWPGGLCVSLPYQKIGLQAPPQVYMRGPMRHPFYADQQAPPPQQQQPIPYQQYNNGSPYQQQQQPQGNYRQQQQQQPNIYQQPQQQQQNIYQQQPQQQNGGYQHEPAAYGQQGYQPQQQQPGYQPQLGYQPNNGTTQQQQQYQPPKQVD
ncbi:ama1 protein, putative [Bodo saltans]|uniref:Ama1 protein, putative n=1 Tax=Bodo saltans TaxID=75058 RepID=A0A0S4III4_BODSA|nr:ama1 protein, putative [Bodo saltans]|eukprot:CUE71943.1 ama1 protein, putative [Bodo saltans]